MTDKATQAFMRSFSESGAYTEYICSLPYPVREPHKMSDESRAKLIELGEERKRKKAEQEAALVADNEKAMEEYNDLKGEK